jgi:hypothetical protein
MSRPTSSVPYLRVIRSPRYFPLWLGQIICNLGDTLNYVALVVLVFRLSQSGLAVSALVPGRLALRSSFCMWTRNAGAAWGPMRAARRRAPIAKPSAASARPLCPFSPPGSGSRCGAPWQQPVHGGTYKVGQAANT